MKIIKIFIIISILLYTGFVYAQTSINAPDLNVSVNQNSVTLSWEQIDNAKGYQLFYAPCDLSYINYLDVGSVLDISFDLPVGSSFYVATKAYNDTLISDFSNVEFFTIMQSDDSQDIDQEIVLINIGDSLTNGVQSGDANVNEFTQIHGFTQILANQMQDVVSLQWNNPLLSIEKSRKDASIIPFNLGVNGATVKSVIEEKTGTGNSLLDELLRPLSESQQITQMEAAEYVASLYPDNIKIFTLWIGNNDVLGAVTADEGTKLTKNDINSFLSDTINGHDLESVKNNFSSVIRRLTAIHKSYIFIATIPFVTDTAFLFNKDDIESLAIFPDPKITALSSGDAIGFGPFYNPLMPSLSVAKALFSDNVTLNTRITYLSNLLEGAILTQDEALIVNNRVNEINTYIKEIANANSSICYVDINSFFTSVLNGDILAGTKKLTKTYGGGIFSLDGVHPSHTGYAMIANEFITAINASSIGLSIPLSDIESVLALDPYQDNDQDGFVPGPENQEIIDSVFIPLTDPDDTDPYKIASYLE